MKKSNGFMRWLTLLLCAILFVSAAAIAEVIDPEDYEGLVILEDPALLGGPEDEEEAEPPATEPPATEAPATEVPTVEPTSEPTNSRRAGSDLCHAGTDGGSDSESKQ